MAEQPDKNTYIDPPPAPVEVLGFPRWMYHPTLPAQVVNDPQSAAALVASDSQWTPNDPNPTT